MAILLHARPIPRIGLDSLCVSIIESRALGLLAPLAQLDRASVYGTEGCRFESCEARFAGSANSSHLQLTFLAVQTPATLACAPYPYECSFILPSMFTFRLLKVNTP